MESDASPVDQLDDAALANIFQRLDASALAAVSLVNTRWHALSRGSVVWRQPFTAAYPHWAARLSSTTTEPVEWRDAYRQRLEADRNWAAGRTRTPATVLRSHTGPVLGVSFLQLPFPPSLAISAGVGAGAEMTLWDLNTPMEGIGFLGWSLLSPVANAEDPLGGLFDVHQRPGTCQVVACSTHTPELRLFELRQRGSEQQEQQRQGQRAAAADPVADDVEERLERLLQLRAASNLRGATSLTSDQLPALEQGWQAVPLAALTGHEAACTTVRCGADLACSASFDGSICIWRLPPDLGAGCSDQDSSLPALAPAARLVDRQQQQPAWEGAGEDEDYPGAQDKGASSLALSPDCSRLASGSDDSIVRFWDLERQQVVGRYRHSAWVWSILGLDPSHRMLASGATDGTLCFWDTRLPEAGVAKLSLFGEEEAYPIAGLALRSDGRYLAAGCFDCNAYTVDLRRRAVAGVLGGHRERVARLDCDDGDRLLTTSFDSDLRLWEF